MTTVTIRATQRDTSDSAWKYKHPRVSFIKGVRASLGCGLREAKIDYSDVLSNTGKVSFKCDMSAALHFRELMAVPMHDGTRVTDYVTITLNDGFRKYKEAFEEIITVATLAGDIDVAEHLKELLEEEES